MLTVYQALSSDQSMNEWCYDRNVKQLIQTPNWVDKKETVEVSGFEPPASRVQGGRSPS